MDFDGTLLDVEAKFSAFNSECAVLHGLGAFLGTTNGTI